MGTQIMLTVGFDKVRGQWNAFVRAHPAAWWWWTEEWIQYSLTYRPQALNASFAVVDEGGTIKGLCPLLIEDHEFQMGGDPLPWPLVDATSSSSQELATISAFLNGRIERVAREQLVTRARFRLSPLAISAFVLPLANHGYEDRSWSSQVIDLSLPIDELHAGIRKSYTSIINKTTRTFHFTDSDTVTLSANVFTDLYHEIYADVGFRLRRPCETDAFLEQWARDRNSLVVVAVHKETPEVAGAAHFYLWKDTAYYASAVYMGDNIAHGVIWEAMRRLKAKGIAKLEMGWQGHAQDQKAHNIETFKRGFGGAQVPLLVMERRWST